MARIIHPVRGLPLVHRPRRLRETPAIRRMVRETRLDPSAFIFPLFVVPGENVRTEIPPMPGNFQVSLDVLIDEAAEVVEAGVSAVMLFGIPETKDEEATGAWAEDGIIQRATRELKRAHPELVVIADTCLCEYMSHGHCGVVAEDGRVENDASVEILARTAVSQARAGADMVAPSDMMDGRIGAIREALDEEGFSRVPIMSYAAKYATCFYGPFRVAADSTPAFGDRRSYQMDPANVREALREVALDIEEGADIIMVKPALPYLDVICRVPRGLRRARGGLSGQRGVRHDQGRRAKRLDRWRDGDDGGADIDQTGGGRSHPDLFREGRRPASEGRIKNGRRLGRGYVREVAQGEEGGERPG